MEKLIKNFNYHIYSENGRIVYSYSYDDAKFTSVIPDSIGARFLDKACNFSASKKAAKK